MNEARRHRLFLVDGSAIVYSAFYALKNSMPVNSRGENTGASFGFIRTLLKLSDVEKPDYLAVIFDTPQPTFRHELYPEYKATRQKMEDSLVDQLPRIKQVVNALNIVSVEVPGLEADDVMGVLAKMAEAENMETFLVSADKDFRQLVSPLIKIYNPKKGLDSIEILDEAGVANKMGVPPARVIDYLALVGDSSDNVPGVAGVGPKTAVDLLKQFEGIEDLYQRLDEVSSESVRAKLAKDRDAAFLSKKLVTIDVNAPIPVKLSDLAVRPPDNEAVYQLLKELEFNSLLDRFKKSAKSEAVNYRTIGSFGELAQFVNTLRACTQVTLDLETTDVDPMRAEIVGLSFSWVKGDAYYIPVTSAATPASGDLFTENKFKGLSAAKVLDHLRPILENPEIKKSGQNAKYDLLVLSRAGIEVQGLDFDTMIASYVINPSLRQHNLDALSLLYFNYTKVPTSDLIGVGKKQTTMADVPIEKVSFYACEDADFTQRLRTVLEPKLVESELKPLFDEVELPLLTVLMEIERNGVSLDVGLLNEMSRELETRLEGLTRAIYASAGQQFNINSTKQLTEIMFNRLGLPIIKRTKTGPSTDVSVLEVLAKEHQLPRDLLEYRQYSKLKSTYIDALPRLINPFTGRVHTSYNQTVAATGRLSSSDPNLQNIPIRTELGRKIRKAFIPVDANHVLLDADYSQIELRIMAHLSEDSTLLQAFHDEKDIHRETAALVFGVPLEEVTDEMRRRAKEVNFGIIYGMGAFGLANRLEISREEAEAFIQNYFANYPGIKEYMELSKEKAREKGYVTTLLNRRRYLPEIYSDNRTVREFAERNAINTPIQGTAADLIKVAMIRIHDRMRREKLQSKMIIQVHDELVFEVPTDEIDAMRTLVVTEMENAIQLKAPIKAETGIGANWLEAH
ncbi:MAG: DNA polymerase I [Candidatus Zhuqueibacterota bacterium]